MMQDYLVAWMNWYYGDDTLPFPIEAQSVHMNHPILK